MLGGVRVLSLKRLAQIMVIIIINAFIFLIFNISNLSARPLHNIQNLEQEIVLETHFLPELIDSVQIYIVGSSSEETSNIIKENIKEYLTYMKFSFIETEYLSQEELNSNPIIIFSTLRPSECIDLKVLGAFISMGGRVLFAAGIPENYEEAYLNPIWGIVEKGNKIAANQFRIMEGFMPYPEVTVDYSGYNASTSLKLATSVTVLMEDSAKIPIVYRNDYLDGTVVVINGTLMQRNNSGGIFSCALANLLDDFLYPTIGTKTVFLDGFPPVKMLDNKTSTELYGRDVESFLRDVLWPEFLKSLSIYDLKYTAGLLEVVEKDDINSITNNKRHIKHLANEIVRFSGEIILMGDYSVDTEMVTERLHEFYKEIKDIFPHYQMKGYSILSGKVDHNNLKIISNIFGELNTFRGIYHGDESNQMVQRYEYKDGFIHFPVISSGYGEGHGDYYNFLSGLSIHGVISHSFNVNTLLTNKELSWNNLNMGYAKLNKDYFGKTRWLKASTLSESSNNTLAYHQLEVRIQYKENEIKVNCNNFMKGQTFYLRSDKSIKEIVGGSFTKINDTYYFIQAQEPQFVILYETN